jgi:hypothetical protein
MDADHYKQIVSMFSENAKTFTQVSIAALILPITFIRQVLGLASDQKIAENLGLALLLSWALFLLAIGAGLLYQYIAVKLVEGRFENSKKLYGKMKWFIENPEKIYATMMIAFYLGACLFVIDAIKRLLPL